MIVDEKDRRPNIEMKEYVFLLIEFAIFCQLYSTGKYSNGGQVNRVFHFMFLTFHRPLLHVAITYIDYPHGLHVCLSVIIINRTYNCHLNVNLRLL